MVDQQEESGPKGIPPEVAVPEKPKSFEVDLSNIKRLLEPLPQATPELRARKWMGGNTWWRDCESRMVSDMEYLRAYLLEAVRFTCEDKLSRSTHVIIGEQTFEQASKSELIKKAIESGNLRTFLALGSEYRGDLRRVMDQITKDYPEVLMEESWERLTRGVPDHVINEMEESTRRNNILRGIEEALGTNFGIEPAEAGTEELLKQEATPLNLRSEIEAGAEKDKARDGEPDPKKVRMFEKDGKLEKIIMRPNVSFL